MNIVIFIDNILRDCLLFHLLQYIKKSPQVENFSEHTCLHLKKEATYRKKNTREQKLELFKNSIGEQSYFIYNVPKIQQMEEAYFRIWGKIITK